MELPDMRIIYAEDEFPSVAEMPLSDRREVPKDIYDVLKQWPLREVNHWIGKIDFNGEIYVYHVPGFRQFFSCDMEKIKQMLKKEIEEAEPFEAIVLVKKDAYMQETIQLVPQWNKEHRAHYVMLSSDTERREFINSISSRSNGMSVNLPFDFIRIRK